MTITVKLKTEKYAILEKLGLAELIQPLKDAGLKLHMQYDGLAIADQNDVELSFYKMSKTTNEVMKGFVTGAPFEIIQGGVKGIIETALKKQTDKITHGQATPGGAEDDMPPGLQKLKPEALGTIIKEHDKKEATMAVKPTNQQVLDSIIKKGKAPDASAVPSVVNLEESVVVPQEAAAVVVPVKLSEAAGMYQPVKGTSSNSKYFVCGITQDGKTKVACRVKGLEVSIRVEGGLTPDVVAAFGKVGVENHGDYLSGHFDCNANVTPARVIGAVLVGSDLPFKTPTPHAKAIAALS